jgi:UDP-glucose 4-epimerase
LEIEKVRILLTGSHGFVGSALSRDLNANCKYQLTTVGRRPSLNKAQNHVEIELSETSNCSHALVGIDVVIHTAARVHMMDDRAPNPLAAFRSMNTHATLTLARQASAAGVKRFIFLSSIKVLGDVESQRQPFDHSQQPRPNDPYGISKFEAELGLFEIAKETGMEVVVIRPPLVYGPGVKANFRQLIGLMSKQLPLPLGSVRNKRSMVALPNLIDLIICCISHPAAVNQTFMVSDNDDLSTPELMKAISNALGKKALLFPVPVSLLRLIGQVTGKSAVIDRLCGSLQVDITNTLTALNWKPPVSVSQGIEQTVAAFLNERKQ